MVVVFDPERDIIDYLNAEDDFSDRLDSDPSIF